MKKLLALLGTALLLASCSQHTPQTRAGVHRLDTSGPAKPALLVPMYMYPSTTETAFTRLANIQNAHTNLWINAILNTDLGIPSSVSALQQKVPPLVQAGVLLLGYVNTNYGQVSLTDAKAKIDQWLQSFPDIQGIFFDLGGDNTAVTPATNNVSYYRSLYTYVRTTKNLDLVVMNVGGCAGAPVRYFDGRSADFIVTREGPASGLSPSYFTSTCDRDGGMAAAITYDAATDPTTNGQLSGLYTRVGAVYFTNDTTAGNTSPYDTLPPYLENVATALATP